MLTFSRQNYTELWIKIASNETLGILDTDYVEDYFGIDGQLTLLEVNTNIRVPILMAEDITASPTVPHDVFRGMIDLTTLADGLYRVEGRVRDTVGNYRIFSEVQSPFGTEDVTDFEIMITPAEVVVRLPKSAQIIEAFTAHNVSLALRSSNLTLDVQVVGRPLSIDVGDSNMGADIVMLTGDYEGTIEETSPITADIIEMYSVS